MKAPWPMSNGLLHQTLNCAGNDKQAGLASSNSASDKYGNAYPALIALANAPSLQPKWPTTCAGGLTARCLWAMAAWCWQRSATAWLRPSSPLRPPCSPSLAAARLAEQAGCLALALAALHRFRNDASLQSSGLQHEP